MEEIRRGDLMSYLIWAGGFNGPNETLMLLKAAWSRHKMKKGISLRMVEGGTKREVQNRKAARAQTTWWEGCSLECWAGTEYSGYVRGYLPGERIVSSAQAMPWCVTQFTLCAARYRSSPRHPCRGYVLEVQPHPCTCAAAKSGPLLK